MLALLIAAILLQQPAATAPATEPPKPSFLKTVRIIHEPPKTVFIGRPCDLELFVDFPRDSVRSVHLFLRTDKMTLYRDIPLRGKYGGYSFRFWDKEMPALTLEYYFVVELAGTAIFATPIDSTGAIRPVFRSLVDPVEYYKRKTP